MSKRMIALITSVHDYLDQHGPIQVENVYGLAKKIGVGSQDLTRVLSIVRSPWWIETQGWTVPYVSKGMGIKLYSVEDTSGKTSRLRNGNRLKSAETETHLRRNLAGLRLEASLASPGLEKQKATILATTTKAAIDLIDAIKS
jgi:hypothetical protein